MREFYFLRHGATDAYLQKQICGGGSNPPLNAYGRDEACNAASLHSQSLAHIRLILHSPLLRAAETARIFSERFGIPLRELPDLREWHLGEWEGQTADDIPHLFTGTDDPPGGEKRLDFETRIAGVQSSLDSFISPVLLVAHGGVWNALMKSIGLSAIPIPRCVPLRICERENIFSVEPLSPLSSSGSAGMSPASARG